MARQGRRQRRRPHLVRIEHYVANKVSGGGRSGEWREFLTCAGEIERLKSFRFDVEREIAGSVASAPIFRVHIDFTPQSVLITNAMRLRDELHPVPNVYHNINAIQDLVGDRRQLTLLCSENVPS